MSVQSATIRATGWLVLFSAVASPLAAQEARWKELNTKFVQLIAKEKFTEARGIAEEGLRVAETSLSPDHPYLATALHNLAFVNQELGRFAEAAPLYERALRIKEKLRGPDHV